MSCYINSQHPTDAYKHYYGVSPFEKDFVLIGFGVECFVLTELKLFCFENIHISTCFMFGVGMGWIVYD